MAIGHPDGYVRRSIKGTHHLGHCAKTYMFGQYVYNVTFKNINSLLRSYLVLILLCQAVNLCKVMLQVVRVDTGCDAYNLKLVSLLQEYFS